MGFRINTNVTSLSAQRHLSNGTEELKKSMEHLASGSRIVRAGEDAAGLAISEKLKAEIRGTTQAQRNSNDGISLIQTAEGGLNEISSIMIRLKELSVQSASDTMGDSERGFSDLEFKSLLQEVDRIANSTEFNGNKILMGQGERLEFQVGTHNDPNLDRMNFNPQESNATTEKLEISALGVLSKQDAQTNLEALDRALGTVNGQRASLGALQNRLMSTVRNLEVKSENLSAANSRIRDADVATETADMAKGNILTAAGTAVLVQANNSSAAALKLIG
ncbi:MAG: flagellin FliC [Oligoflexia bacterium]|nr:flagellin FliC [Oligoflexia bacterium]